MPLGNDTSCGYTYIYASSGLTHEKKQSLPTGLVLLPPMKRTWEEQLTFLCLFPQVRPIFYMIVVFCWAPFLTSFLHKQCCYSIGYVHSLFVWLTQSSCWGGFYKPFSLTTSSRHFLSSWYRSLPRDGWNPLASHHCGCTENADGVFHCVIRYRQAFRCRARSSTPVLNTAKKRPCRRGAPDALADSRPLNSDMKYIIGGSSVPCGWYFWRHCKNHNKNKLFQKMFLVYQFQQFNTM